MLHSQLPHPPEPVNVDPPASTPCCSTTRIGQSDTLHVIRAQYAVTAHHHTQVKIQSPGQSLPDRHRIAQPQSPISGESSQVPYSYAGLDEPLGSNTKHGVMVSSLAAITPRPTIEVVRPEFLQWLKTTLGSQGNEFNHLCHCLAQIHELQSQWDRSDKDGFITEDLARMDKTTYDLLQLTVDLTWKYKAKGNLELERWGVFLCCVRIDWWRLRDTATVIAPTFEEDLTFGITSAMSRVLREAEGDTVSSRVTTSPSCTVTTPRLCFCLKYASVHAANTLGQGDAQETMVFCCLVAQSVKEFMYNIDKLLEALPHLPVLHGFVLSMITPATHGDDDYGVLKIPGTGERMQSCMLVYTRDNFTSFVQHAGSRMTLRQWEEDDHFMHHARIYGREPPESFFRKRKGPGRLSTQEAVLTRREELPDEIALRVYFNVRWVAGNMTWRRERRGVLNLAVGSGPYGPGGTFRSVLYT
ncbi:uncharacterized protein B0H18DRAFT_959587 [Fomitopsis serialis]|uniref:uncharacterized protein n=1 Tax=Fomitopsis serialis TaxID=139415 RepID=UPI002007B6BE|nr:uncharacterized protein B0H18DRAFT_959587 [Neoantrodia serialis]KAH9914849.1 hypothetical protein B0H18DRAFT_959587 [Neoantrodia serialis]